MLSLIYVQKDDTLLLYNLGNARKMLPLPRATNPPEAAEFDWCQGHISAKFTQLTNHRVHCPHRHGPHWLAKYRESFPILLTTRRATSWTMKLIVSEIAHASFPNTLPRRIPLWKR
jgi:hypothetical protein